MVKKDDTHKPMDDSIRERSEGQPIPTRERTCWAIKQLLSEVEALFPETPYEVGDRDMRGVALVVNFDVSGLEGGDSVVFNSLIEALSSDARVEEIATEDFGFASVRMRSSLRTQDDRTPFGLSEAYSILVEDEFDGGSQ